jgi:4-hydroxybenzoate polyprenyltransferase
MVKIEHSVFALPFAYIGVVLAAGGWPGLRVFVFLTLAMVAVRSFSMAINRLADASFDRANSRTQDRPLVTGEMTMGQGWTLCAAAAAVFVLACAGLNSLCLALSPVALLWAGLYSWSKRFTWLTHFWLGSVLGLAPIGGWLAHDPVFTLPAVLFALGVTCWVAGFDILYACQDTEFDRQSGLNSIPACFGITAALGFSTLSHLMAALFFLLAGWSAGLGAVYFVFWAVISAVLIWEHTLVSADDLSRVNMAFFTLNGLIAVILCLGVMVDVL